MTGLNPATRTAAGGAFTVTVTGVRFQASSVVYWKSMARPTTYVNSTTLTAAIPATDIAIAGAVNVRVVTPGPGGGASNNKTVTINNPVPVITTLSPASKKKGSGAFTLSVTGTGFVVGSKVRWKGVDRVTTYVSGTSLKASIPAADIAVAGSAAVTVLNVTPGGGTSNTKTFTITP